MTIQQPTPSSHLKQSKVKLLFIILLSLFIGLNSSKAETKEVVLGATIPLTGDFISYGKTIKEGITLAAEDLKSQGISVRIVYEDVPYPGPQAATAISKLIYTDKIQGLAANFLNPAIPVMEKEINKNKLLSFHTAAADDLILASGRYVFSTNARIRDEAQEIANHVYHKLNARTASVLYITTTFGENYARYFKNQFESLGGKVLYYDTTAVGEVDLRPALTRVRSKKADVFLAAYFGTHMGMVLKQARSIGIKTPIFGVYETEDASVIEVAGNAAEGVHYFSPEPRIPSTLRINFIERFSMRFGYKPGVLATNAYDATISLAQALSNCIGNTECAREKLIDKTEYQGVSGKFILADSETPVREFTLKTVMGSQFKVEKSL